MQPSQHVWIEVRGIHHNDTKGIWTRQQSSLIACVWLVSQCGSLSLHPFMEVPDTRCNVLNKPMAPCFTLQNSFNSRMNVDAYTILSLSRTIDSDPQRCVLASLLKPGAWFSDTQGTVQLVSELREKQRLATNLTGSKGRKAFLTGQTCPCIEDSRWVNINLQGLWIPAVAVNTE